MEFTVIVKTIDFKGLPVQVEYRKYDDPGIKTGIVDVTHGGRNIEKFLIKAGLWDDFEFIALESV